MNQRRAIRILFFIYIMILIPFYIHNLPIHFLLIDSLLAYIPLEIYFYIKKTFSRKSTVFLLGFYILFLPNNAYLLTDLIHLNRISFYTTSNTIMSENISIWIMFTLVISGILSLYNLGLRSEKGIINLLSKRYSWTRSTSNTMMLLLFFLNSIGVFLGRFLRFNSVNVFNHPMLLLSSISSMLNLKFIVFIFLFTILQIILFFVSSLKE